MTSLLEPNGSNIMQPSNCHISQPPPFQFQFPLSSIPPKNKQSAKKAHKSKFTKEEDEQLYSLVQKYGENEWTLISKQMVNRNSRQCRERWKNYINPRLTTREWTEEEDFILLSKHQEIGAHWNLISKFFSNRSINSVRNRAVKLFKSISVQQNKRLNNIDMNYEINNENIQPPHINNCQSFPNEYDNNNSYNSNSLIENQNNSLSTPEQVIETHGSAESQSPLGLLSVNNNDINNNKKPDVTPHKKNLFDIFWDPVEEIDVFYPGIEY